ncbi:Spo0B domain-containing protein [Clavibacter michiganensis]|uniref:sensor histidine kinase n=1 Tax=Clavibacter michiganensis TaxID=28447 RepID=UPI0026DC877C|nr:ATP-binding protein [Clavibacter michiganensis]MDO4024372.1 Spo0B domain-containing protein [Clavibacter michiganensis]MDO4034359.1 Spo0B domain-containing protein [Clavibacter michiganensis]MDO4046305.1 Spo0B domain-containing protein [Clavibacter michiganensis]MDO4105098.1 Spo0B domain-containing protein [Clavibacter michiganensis]MDO4129316.1 Spo0B domain-containing protein [Clavibacter michiganensis]
MGEATGRRRAGLDFARRTLVLQLLVVLVVVGIATVAYGLLSSSENREEAQATALAIARTAAEDPALRAAVTAETADPGVATASDLADGPVQLTAEAVRERTGALFVVVTDDRGLRLAHPDASELGQRVSTDPTVALAGREEVTWATGTLGESARAKVPVRALADAGAGDGGGASGDDRVVGEVSVGFAAATVRDSIGVDVAAIAVVALLALGVGAVASGILSRRLARLTLGLQPSELAGLVQDQAAVLSGVGEGVLGIGPDGRVTVCNPRAAALLGLVDPVGRTLADLGVAPVLRDAVAGAQAGADAGSPSLRAVVDDRLLFVDVARVDRDGRDLGTVMVLRDETDIEAMSRRLTAVTAMSTALRVQRHEFANRLHVVRGLVATGRVDEADSYLAGVLEQGPVAFPTVDAGLVDEPYLQAFLGAKAMEAEERGVALRVGPGTLVRGILVRPEEVTTVLGNLVDNAMHAAVRGSRADRWVEVEALDDGVDLHIAVSDSGDGLAASDAGRVFQRRPDDVDGAAEALAASGGGDPAHGLGFGLPLVRDIARRDGGDVWVADPGGPPPHAEAGAVFCARLAGVVEPPDADPPAPTDDPSDTDPHGARA